jgi:hypothetical protein
MGGLVVADRGNVRRSVLVDPASEEAAENIGEPFPSESGVPVDGICGDGQWEVMRALGFDPWVWQTARPLDVFMHRENMEDAEFRRTIEAAAAGKPATRATRSASWFGRLLGG